jgi:pimeloyl-ACP methyl ester carboxylesterase
VYDFEGKAGQSSGPPRILMALELPRVAGEYGVSRALDLVRRPRATGNRRPVLVIPGFMAEDWMTGRLRDHLARHGYAVHGWANGRNIGLTDKKIDGLIARFEDLRDRYDEPISIVGWSFGGLLARWLAHTYPDDVRQIICLGSPWRADGEKTRATAMFEKSRERNGISDRARPMVGLARNEPVPVPVTAVWSKTDGIVPWRGCRVAGSTAPPAENISVLASHFGMVASPLVLAIVVDRLGQEVDDWRPYAGPRLMLSSAVEERETVPR